MQIVEIAPDTAVHCVSKEQVDYLVNSGFLARRFEESDLPVWVAFYEGADFPSSAWMPEYKSDHGITGKQFYKERGLKCVEFTDLVIPEDNDDLSAAEVLQICAEICVKYSCSACPMNEARCFKSVESDKETVIKICKDWKAMHGMLRVIDVAQCLFEVYQERSGAVLVDKKLYQLLYFVQKESIAQQGKAMFREDLRVWCAGSLVCDDLLVYWTENGVAAEGIRKLPSDAEEIIKKVVDEYGIYESWWLGKLLTRELPDGVVDLKRLKEGLKHS